jgi:hypothetical protein
MIRGSSPPRCSRSCWRSPSRTKRSIRCRAPSHLLAETKLPDLAAVFLLSAGTKLLGKNCFQEREGDPGQVLPAGRRMGRRGLLHRGDDGPGEGRFHRRAAEKSWGMN